MKLIDFSLVVQKKILLKNVNVEFEKGVINHILGSNGVGKSCFAKSVLGLFKHTGTIEMNSAPVVIGSYTNVPLDLTTQDIVRYLEKSYGIEKVQYFVNLLNLKESINFSLCIKKLSDGQKQKIKLMYFLINEPQVIILDEFTSSLDKKSTLEIYSFLNDYILDKNITCLNITHNLTDIEYLPGKYYFFYDKSIDLIDTKEEIIDLYIKGGI